MLTDLEGILREMQVNREAYDRLKEDIVRDYAGRYIALAFGRIIGTGETYGEAVAVIQQLGPAPLSFEVFLAGEEPQFDTILNRYTEFV